MANSNTHADETYSERTARNVAKERAQYNGLSTVQLTAAIETIRHAQLNNITPAEAKLLTPEQVAKMNAAITELQTAAEKLDILFNYARTAFQMGARE